MSYPHPFANSTPDYYGKKNLRDRRGLHTHQLTTPSAYGNTQPTWNQGPDQSIQWNQAPVNADPTTIHNQNPHNQPAYPPRDMASHQGYAPPYGAPNTGFTSPAHTPFMGRSDHAPSISPSISTQNQYGSHAFLPSYGANQPPSNPLNQLLTPQPRGSRSSHHYSESYPSPPCQRHSAPCPANQIHIPESSPDDHVPGNSREGKRCSHCNTTSTPVWRRDPRTHKSLCNACALYARTGRLRPQNLIDVDSNDVDSNKLQHVDDSDGEYDGPECINCGARKTPTWRRQRSGEQLCNACGMHERTHDEPRP
ncbi:hypothetical protein C8R43DRAFT_958846 [Mycena crocata]|nr:hypothetical protein C8R43DRAFT_958846 [Mycena crocata]